MTNKTDPPPGIESGTLLRAEAQVNDWQRFSQECGPALGMLLIAAHARLRERQAHGWTIAAAPSHARILASRRTDLESALARARGGSPSCVHVVELGQ